MHPARRAIRRSYDRHALEDGAARSSAPTNRQRPEKGGVRPGSGAFPRRTDDKDSYARRRVRPSATLSSHTKSGSQHRSRTGYARRTKSQSGDCRHRLRPLHLARRRLRYGRLARNSLAPKEDAAVSSQQAPLQNTQLHRTLLQQAQTLQTDRDPNDRRDVHLLALL